MSLNDDKVLTPSFKIKIRNAFLIRKSGVIHLVDDYSFCGAVAAGFVNFFK